MARLFLMYAILEEAFEIDEEYRRKRLRLAKRRRHRRLIKTAIRKEDFIKNYRLSEELVESLENDIYTYIPFNMRISALPIRTKILCTLSFLANSGYQNRSDLNALVSQSSMSRVLHQVINALCHPDNVKKFIKWPQNTAQRQIIQDRFLEKFGIPNVIGCVGSTLVALVRPKTNDKEYYYKKKLHAINVQLICDADSNIIQVNCSGAALSDSTIFEQSSIKDCLENLHEAGEKVYLFGNSNYPQRPYLMTPFQNAKSDTPAAHYNKLHTTVYNNTIELTLQSLKGRFRCLLAEKPLHYPPEMVGKIVTACCVLHNICNKAELYEPELTEEDFQNESKAFSRSHVPEQRPEGEANCCVRSAIVNKLANSL